MVVEARHLGERRGALENTASHIMVFDYIVHDVIIFRHGMSMALARRRRSNAIAECVRNNQYLSVHRNVGHHTI
jgi:hypothetical protein